MQHLDSIEDAVQWAMTQALELWCVGDMPSSPSAWLYQVAYRHLLSEFRTTQRRSSLLTEHFATTANAAFEDEVAPFSGEMSDSMLRMLFVTCNDAIPIEYQLVFTEGYLSSHIDTAIRQDLCKEAIRLTRLLATSKFGDVPDSYALLALMYFHLARIITRQDDFGTLLLLEQQDRRKWNQPQITMAMAFLAQSATGDTISRYHIEAGIAAEHCLSPSFEQTQWQKIVASYELLLNIAPSPLHQLNRAIATAQWKDPQAGLAVLMSADTPDWLDRSYHWYAVQSDLLFRCGEMVQGQEYAERAIAAAPTDSIKQLLDQRSASKVTFFIDSKDVICKTHQDAGPTI